MGCIPWTINIFVSNDSPALRGGGGCDTDEDDEANHSDEEDRTTAKRNKKPGRPPACPHGRPSSGLSMADGCLLGNANI